MNSILKERACNGQNATQNGSYYQEDEANRKKFKSSANDLSPIENPNKTSKSNSASFISVSNYSTPIVPSVNETPKDLPTLSLENLHSKKRKKSDDEDSYCYLKSEINTLLTCPMCKNLFNQTDKLPKQICEKLTACSKCVKNKNKIECLLCCKIHLQSDKGFQTNFTILSLISLKPTKINNEEIVLKTKNDKSFRDLNSSIELISNRNSKLKLKLDNFSEECKKLKSKAELAQAKSTLEKIKEIYENLIEKSKELDNIFEQEENGFETIEILDIKTNDDLIEINDKKEEFSIVSLDFSKISHRDAFYPITKRNFFMVQSEPNNESVDYTLSVIDQKMNTLNQKNVKQIQIESFKIMFDPIYLNIILNTAQKQLISIFEYGTKFHNLKCVGHSKKILFINSEEIFVFSDTKSIITILDHNFTKKENFGQNTNENEAYYLPKNGFEIIFSNKQVILIKDVKKKMLRALDKQSGEYSKQSFYQDSNLYLNKVIVDKYNRVVLLDKTCQKLMFLDLNLIEIKKVNISVELNFDNWYLTNENELAFSYYSKSLIKFIKL
ncbi:unnamed protein product [Brachionus calyciflorus]|uniref:Uncharacterized protein n=1 Tax=Brachionus calyciflorus TaxID=104777 RepID=A0A813NK87_9BILA|nr:unnamed protein product [Brachionus calyciflorus]